MGDVEKFSIAGFQTQGGITLDVELTYKTYGELSPNKDNVVLMPTYYGGRHTENESLFGPGRAVDPSRHFVVVPNMFGNGRSTSPDNTPAPYGRGAFPLFTVYDNVVCQHRLVTEHLGLERLRLVTGFSMGAMQTYQWGALYADMLDGIAPICGSARISDHNHLFVSSAVETLRLDPAFKDGWYDAPPVRGLLAFGRVYAAWLFSQDFFRERIYEQLGLASPEDVVRFAQNYFLANDANNLVAMARTWLNGDISANQRFKEDFSAALAAITCPAIVMPGDTDLYFRVADNAAEVAHMPNAELRPIPSKWGHGAGFCVDPADVEFMDRALRDLLE